MIYPAFRLSSILIDWVLYSLTAGDAAPARNLSHKCLFCAVCYYLIMYGPFDLVYPRHANGIP